MILRKRRQKEMISKKVHLSLSEEEVAKFDMLRNELGMNRSQYFCYLLSGQKKQMPDSIRYKESDSKAFGYRSASSNTFV
jgi:hypothetical protein